MTTMPRCSRCQRAVKKWKDDKREWIAPDGVRKSANRLHAFRVRGGLVAMRSACCGVAL